MPLISGLRWDGYRSLFSAPRVPTCAAFTTHRRREGDWRKVRSCPPVVSASCLFLMVFLVQEDMRASVATLYGRGRGVGE